MRDIQIVFTKSKKKIPLISWLIRLWTWKLYSHVAVCFDTTNYFGTNTYYQASEGMVNYMSEIQFNKKHEIVKKYELKLEEMDYYHIRKACHEETGAPYGVMQNIGIMLADTCSLFGYKIKNPWKKGRNCSELLYVHIFNNIGNYSPDLIKPHHIEEILTTSYRR